MRCKPLPLSRLLLLALGIVVFLFSYYLKNLFGMNISILMVWLSNIFYGCEKIKTRVYYLAFMGTFFTFLLGKTVSNILGYSENEYSRYFNYSIDAHTCLCLFIALVTCSFVFPLLENLKISILEGHTAEKPAILYTMDYYTQEYNSVRTVALLLFYFTIPFALLVGLDKAIFVSTSGYADFYVNYTSRFPYIIVKLGDFCRVAFLIFLATFPRKKETIIPIILYVCLAVLGMFSGKRTELIAPLAMVILYAVSRNHINTVKPWVTKKHVWLMVAAAPFMLAALYLYNNYRFGFANSEKLSIVKSAADFFDSTGFSVNVISFEKLYASVLPDKIYSFGDTIDYLRENLITQMFVKLPVYSSNTVEKALNGNLLAEAITYRYSAPFYLSGRGLGSCYIAEAYHDFGYGGIVLWSTIYCLALKYLFSFEGKGIIYCTLSLQALRSILLAPRNAASLFISEYISIDTWLVIVMVFVGAFIWRKLDLSFTFRRRSYES
ncbi:MAG: O-antigen polysaccharide polymerase Wzy family protein [Oscillospiraceae bacterium]|nr:O-antigen polysaccharide polymerase Wzy family protein [Oscillospiraceae bacterium]